MEATIKPASEVAAEALDYLRTGKRKVVFGKNKTPIKSKPKIKKRYFAIIFIVILIFCPLLFIEKKYQIEGSINIGGQIIKNHKIYFLEKEGAIQSVVSNENGNFNIKLKKGFYKIYFEKNAPRRYLMPETTPFAIKLSRNLKNIRLYVKS